MNVPKLRFKEFTDEWSNKKLNEIVKFSKGNILSKADLNNEGQYPCILYGQLYTKYHEVIKEILGRTDRNDKNLIKSKYGDILIPSSGETPIDISTSSCVLLDNILIGGDINILSPINSDGRFISYMISNNKKIEIAKVAQGHSIVHLYNENLKSIKLSIPSKDEQTKIANFLSLLDKKIELQTKKVEDLKLYKKGLFSNIAFDNMQKFKLEEILQEQNEKSTIVNQYKILSSTANGLFLQSEYFNKQAASENNIGYKILKRNQLVLSPQNLWMGNININDKYDIGIVSPSYKIFNIDTSIINIQYFNNWIRTPRALYEYMISSEQGASIVRRNLNMDLFNSIIIKLPPINIQNKIGENIYSFNRLIELESNKLIKLQKLKKGFMQNMFV